MPSRQQLSNPLNKRILFDNRIRKYINRHDAVQAILDNIVTYFTLNKGKKLTKKMVPWMCAACPGYHVGWDTTAGMIHLNMWNGTLIPADEPFRFLIAYTQTYGKPSDADACDPEAVTRYTACYRQTPEYRNSLEESLKHSETWIADLTYHLQEIRKVIKQAEELGMHHSLTTLFKEEYPL